MSQKQLLAELSAPGLITATLFVGMSVPNFKLLRRVQNTLARVVLCRRKFEHITTALIDLHWLPVQYPVTYKLATLTYSIKRSGHLHIYMNYYKTTNQPILSALLLMTCLRLLVLDLLHLVS